MEYEFIKVVREGPITTITLDRPSARNALFIPMHWELHRAFDDFATDPDQWVAIVTGSGDIAFCAGSDVKQYDEDGFDLDWPPSGYGGLMKRFDLDKPVIAAVNGVSLGGGFELALTCDLIVAAEHATFGLPEPKFGLAALGGGVLHLTRQIPLKQAMDIILTSRLVSAAEGLAMGFVNEVVPKGEALAAAHRLAASIVACAPLAVRASKRVALDYLALPFSEAVELQLQHPAAQRMVNSADAREGPRAFVEKRSPRWVGK